MLSSLPASIWLINLANDAAQQIAFQTMRRMNKNVFKIKKKNTQIEPDTKFKISQAKAKTSQRVMKMIRKFLQQCTEEEIASSLDLSRNIIKIPSIISFGKWFA